MEIVNRKLNIIIFNVNIIIIIKSNQNTFVNITMIKSTHLEQQNQYYKKYFASVIYEKYDKKYNSYGYKETTIQRILNVINYHECNAIRRRLTILNRRKKETFYKILETYPSIKNEYDNEINKFIDIYTNHKNYFYNNIFEELMAKTWHPNNFEKFHLLDPTS